MLWITFFRNRAAGPAFASLGYGRAGAEASALRRQAGAAARRLPALSADRQAADRDTKTVPGETKTSALDKAQ